MNVADNVLSFLAMAVGPGAKRREAEIIPAADADQVVGVASAAVVDAVAAAGVVDVDRTRDGQSDLNRRVAARGEDGCSRGDEEEPGTYDYVDG